MQNNTLLTGSLSFIGLPDLFQILGGNSSTGMLRITSQYSPSPGIIYFLKGNPINSTCGALKGIKAIYALFGWADGVFEFQQKDVNTEHLIKQGRMEIVLDALRMLDDGLIKKVGPPTLEEIVTVDNSGAPEVKALPVIKGPLVDYSYVIKEEYFGDGASIVNEGSHGKWMWVIYEGSVKVSRETPNGAIEIARLGEGSFIGTLKSLLFGEYTRSASVTAAGDVRLCLLDSEHLYTEFTSQSSNFRNLLISLDERLRKINDRIVVSYTGNDKLSHALKNKKIMLKKGSTQDELFIIREGEAYLIGQAGNRQVPLLALGQDDVFGKIQFLNYGQEPQSAFVLGTDDLKVERLDISEIQKEHDMLSNTFKNLIFHMCSCISLATGLLFRIHDQK